MWHTFCAGRHGGAVASTVASQQEGSGFEPTGRLGPFCVDSACSPRACAGSLRVLPQSKRQVRLTSDSKLPVGVNVSVSICRPCDWLATSSGCTWVYPAARPVTAGIGTLLRISGIDNGWMDRQVKTEKICKSTYFLYCWFWPFHRTSLVQIHYKYTASSYTVIYNFQKCIHYHN